MTVRARALWLVGLVLVIFVALTTYGLNELHSVQQKQDQDMCALIGALLPTGGATPSPGSGLEAQRRAVTEYRASRCR